MGERIFCLCDFKLSVDNFLDHFPGDEVGEGEERRELERELDPMVGDGLGL